MLMRALPFFALITALACGGSNASVKPVVMHDAGTFDAGNTLTDAGTRDAGMTLVDAATHDDAGAPDSSIDKPFTPPTSLAETGLYADIQADKLADGVRAYQPAYELWADGASKRRFFFLPPNTVIDTSDMDHWVFPVGTKLWKEFSKDGVRVETRLLQKTAPDTWYKMAFIWQDDLGDALPAVDGMMDARGTDHDVPAQKVCGKCHESTPDRVLGISAIQLSHNQGELDIMTLAPLLSVPPAAPFMLPGDDATQSALGYLHANCGHCHNDSKKSTTYKKVDLQLWLKTSALGSMEETSTYVTAVNQECDSNSTPDASPNLRITPGKPDESALVYRMLLPPDDASHMPGVASNVIDQDHGVKMIKAWIEGL